MQLVFGGRRHVRCAEEIDISPSAAMMSTSCHLRQSPAGQERNKKRKEKERDNSISMH